MNTMVPNNCDYWAERQSIENWSSAKMTEEMETYQREHNRVSIDGFPSGMFEEG